MEMLSEEQTRIRLEKIATAVYAAQLVGTINSFVDYKAVSKDSVEAAQYLIAVLDGKEFTP